EAAYEDDGRAVAEIEILDEFDPALVEADLRPVAADKPEAEAMSDIIGEVVAEQRPGIGRQQHEGDAELVPGSGGDRRGDQRRLARHEEEPEPFQREQAEDRIIAPASDGLTDEAVKCAQAHLRRCTLYNPAPPLSSVADRGERRVPGCSSAVRPSTSSG